MRHFLRRLRSLPSRLRARLWNDGLGTSPEEVERSEQAFYRSYLQEGMTVFDVGANIGDVSILFARLVSSQGQVHAFEATSKTFKQLQMAVVNSGHTNITINHIAVADREAVLDLHVYPEKQSGWNTLAVRPLQNYGIDVKPTHIEPVQAITIDEYCRLRNIAQIDLLKIDVEGAEYQVLRGAEQMLREGKVGCCIFEFGQTTFDMGNDPSEIHRFLKSCGLHVQNIVRRDPIFPGGKRVETARFSLMVAAPR